MVRLEFAVHRYQSRGDPAGQTTRFHASGRDRFSPRHRRAALPVLSLRGRECARSYSGRCVTLFSSTQASEATDGWRARLTLCFTADNYSRNLFMPGRVRRARAHGIHLKPPDHAQPFKWYLGSSDCQKGGCMLYERTDFSVSSRGFKKLASRSA